MSKYQNPDPGFRLRPLKKFENLSYPDQSKTEEEIWIDFKQGSDTALSYIYRRYVDALFNYGCQIVNDEQFVQDCIQDLFIDLIRNRNNLADVHSVKAYLFASLKRKTLRRIVKERHTRTEEINDRNEGGFEIVCSQESRMITDHLTAERERLINIACQKLTRKQRESILLYFYEGFSYKEVAEIMGMGKVKSARVMLYRSLAILQSSLAKVKDQLLTLILFFVLLLFWQHLNIG